MKSRLWLALSAVVAVAVFGIVVTVYGPGLVIGHGSSVWIPISETSPLIPKSVRLALRGSRPAAKPGAVQWRQLRPGFEVAELPALVGDAEVDRILLARIDPHLNRFVVRNDATGQNTLDRWMEQLPGALLVMNGSYYGPSGKPATPVLIDGQLTGPNDYVANQGAFVASASGAEIVDLARRDWRQALSGQNAAMVSYPLLVAQDGSNRAPVSRWLANRTFLAQDRSGRILLGTTKGSFFTLHDLGPFLKVAPLEVAMALDLDGGPVACQGVAVDGFVRKTCGEWEIQVDKAGHAKLLPKLPGIQAPMPMAVAVYAR